MLEAFLLARHEHAACDPTRSNRPDGDPHLVTMCAGYFLANRARIYYDIGHLEWSAPEAGNPYQALVYDRAAELSLSEAARAAASKLGGGQSHGDQEQPGLPIRGDLWLP